MVLALCFLSSIDLSEFYFENIFSAVGAGEVHHSELSEDVYKDPATKIYVDNIGSARTELASLDAPIVGEVGDVINRAKPFPSTGITIFHSMGMLWRPQVPLFGIVFMIFRCRYGR